MLSYDGYDGLHSSLLSVEAAGSDVLMAKYNSIFSELVYYQDIEVGSRPGWKVLLKLHNEHHLLMPKGAAEFVIMDSKR